MSHSVKMQSATRYTQEASTVEKVRSVKHMAMPANLTDINYAQIWKGHKLRARSERRTKNVEPTLRLFKIRPKEHLES